MVLSHVNNLVFLICINMIKQEVEQEQPLKPNKHLTSKGKIQFQQISTFFSNVSKHAKSNANGASMHVGCGTEEWRAPETYPTPDDYDAMMMSPDYDPESTAEPKVVYSYPADVFSLGLTLWEILCIQPMESMQRNGLPLQFTKDIPFYIRLLILACIDPRPQLRPTAKQIVDVLTLHLYMIDFVAMYLNNSTMLKL
eukprot:UN01706